MIKGRLCNRRHALTLASATRRRRRPRPRPATGLGGVDIASRRQMPNSDLAPCLVFRELADRKEQAEGSGNQSWR